MKRFKITGTGKVLRRSPYMRHLRRKKSKKLIRRYRHYKVVGGSSLPKSSKCFIYKPHQNSKCLELKPVLSAVKDTKKSSN